MHEGTCVYSCTCLCFEPCVFKINLEFIVYKNISRVISCFQCDMFPHYLIMCFCIAMIHSIEIDLDFQDKVTEGQKRYDELLEKIIPYGDCWTEAMFDLRTSCKQLNEEIQSRLALSFSNCLLKHTGRDPCPCPKDIPIADCLRNSSDLIYHTYTEFYTQTQSICHYLQHREWQNEAAKTVLMLTESSAEVSRKLDESSKSQSRMLDLQVLAINGQERLISNSKSLNSELQKARDNAENVYNKFKATSDEQRLLLFEVFDQVNNLQNFVLGEFSGVYTVAYYVIAASISYLLTSVSRTSEARIWLILVITLNAGLERSVTSYSINESALNLNLLDKNDLVYYRIWFCRKIVCSVCFIILAVCYYQYKDYNMINNQLLKEIQQQNMELQMFIKGMSLGENVHNLPKADSSTNVSSILFETPQGKMINKGVSRSNAVKHSTPKQTILVENKENNQVKSAKARVKKLATIEKKSSFLRSPGNTPKGLIQENTSINLSEIESSISKQYNLRRSSRLNSPQLLPSDNK